MSALFTAADPDRPLLVIGNRNYSSWSLRAWLFLASCGIPFDTLRLSLDTDEFRRRIGDYTPAGRVPVLIHGSLRIWDSLAICEYIAETFDPPQAWPASVVARATARAIVCEMHAGFPDLRRELPMNCRARDRRVDISANARRDIDRIIEIWDECLLASDGPWLFGAFGIADAMYAPVALRFLSYAVDLPPASTSWVETMISMPPMLDWLRLADMEIEVLEHDEAGAPGPKSGPGSGR
ncbi:MAG: glutathione S-transferase family protein [Gammaproteobacteria bacterium]